MGNCHEADTILEPKNVIYLVYQNKHEASDNQLKKAFKNYEDAYKFSRFFLHAKIEEIPILL